MDKYHQEHIRDEESDNKGTGVNTRKAYPPLPRPPFCPSFPQPPARTPHTGQATWPPIHSSLTDMPRRFGVDAFLPPQGSRGHQHEHHIIPKAHTRIPIRLLPRRHRWIQQQRLRMAILSTSGPPIPCIQQPPRAYRVSHHTMDRHFSQSPPSR